MIIIINFFFPKKCDINKDLKKVKEDDEYFFNVKDKRITLEKNRKIQLDMLKY